MQHGLRKVGESMLSMVAMLYLVRRGCALRTRGAGVRTPAGRRPGRAARRAACRAAC